MLNVKREGFNNEFKWALERIHEGQMINFYGPQWSNSIGLHGRILGN